MDTDKSEHEIIVRRNKHSFTKSDAPFILNFDNLKEKVYYLSTITYFYQLPRQLCKIELALEKTA